MKPTGSLRLNIAGKPGKPRPTCSLLLSPSLVHTAGKPSGRGLVGQATFTPTEPNHPCPRVTEWSNTQTHYYVTFFFLMAAKVVVPGPIEKPSSSTIGGVC